MFHYNTVLTAEADGARFRIGLSVIAGALPAAYNAFAADLTAPEQEQLNRQRTDAARNSFCLGRAAAKAAVGQIIPDAVPTLTVAHGIFGFPVLVPNPAGLCLSIAHTDASGAALCYPETLLMGVDLEPVVASHCDTMRSAFTAPEQQMQVAGIPEVLLVHLLWSAREALSKALRTGFLVPLPLLEVQSVTTVGNHYRIEFTQFGLFTAVAVMLDNQVLVLVFPKKVRLQLPEDIRHHFSHGAAALAQPAAPLGA